MANLSTANVTAIADALARGYDLQAALLGADETTNDTWRKLAKLVWDTAISAADASEAQSPLTNLAGVANDARTNFAPSVFIKDRLQAIVQGLINECDANLGDYLNDNDLRVHYSFGDLFYYVTGLRLSPISVVFPPVQIVAHIVRGASTWTFTGGTAVDTTKYGGAQLRLRAKSIIGASDCVCTLTCVKADGSSEQRSATMPQASAVDTYVDVGSASNLYVSVSAISVTGGTNGDDIDVETKLVRSIATALS